MWISAFSPGTLKHGTIEPMTPWQAFSWIHEMSEPRGARTWPASGTAPAPGPGPHLLVVKQWRQAYPFNSCSLSSLSKSSSLAELRSTGHGRNTTGVGETPSRWAQTGPPVARGLPQALSHQSRLEGGGGAVFTREHSEALRASDESEELV